MYNKIIIIGNAGADANVSDNIVRLNIATSYSYKKGDEWVNETQWHNVTVFGGMGNYAKKVMKGDVVQVDGRFKSSKYRNQDGVEKEGFAIIADNMKIISTSGAPKESRQNQVDNVPAPDQSGLPF